jgi:hypothetical protein
LLLGGPVEEPLVDLVLLAVVLGPRSDEYSVVVERRLHLGDHRINVVHPADVAQMVGLHSDRVGGGRTLFRELTGRDD